MFENTLSFAKSLDEKDSLKKFRDRFHIPVRDGRELIYFCSNSLGPEPKKAKEYVIQEMDDWAGLGVSGHFKPDNTWYYYKDYLKGSSARLLGTLPDEVSTINTLSANIH